MDPNRNPNGGGMSSVSGRVQRGPATMANARATYVPGPTTMANARATYVPGPTTMANARATYEPNFQETLDKVVSDYSRTAADPLGFVNRMGGQVSQSVPSTGLDQLLGMMYETSGGANYATIRQLEAQRLAAQQNYKTNRADAQNMYGTLSMDAAVPSTGLIGQIEAGGKQVQAGYTASLEESKTRSDARQLALTEEQKRQQANRERVAAELGMAPESIQTSYASDEALSKGAGDVASAATSWENLLRAQQGSAAESNKRMITAAGNTKNQTLLGMKALLDQQQAQLNAAISAERSKAPTQKLTDVGKILQRAMNEQVLKDSQSRFPEIFGTPEQKLNSGARAQQDVMANWGIKNVNEYNMILQNAYAKNQARSAGDTSEANRLTPKEAAVLASLNIPQYLMD